MLKVAALEGDCPGFVTVTRATPVVAIKEAGTVALSVAPPELTIVVARAVPFQETATLAVTTPETATASVKFGPPATAVSGKMRVILSGEMVAAGLILVRKASMLTP